MKIKPTFWIFIALLIIADEVHFLLCALPAIFIHETGHLLVIFFSKVKIKGLTLSGVGAEITVDGMVPYWTEIAINISGPIFSIIAAYVFSLLNLYTLSGISMVLGVFNMLPVSILDGGKVLNSLLKIVLDPDIADKISFMVSVFTSFVILILGIIGIVMIVFSIITGLISLLAPLIVPIVIISLVLKLFKKQ